MTRPTLKKGMSGKKGTDIGEAILLWRLFLGKPELKPAAGVSSYDFGAATDKATRDWQKSVGLNPNGVVDDKTWAVYDGRMSVASPAVQATAKAAETMGEANKAAAMAAAVAKVPAKAAAAKPPTVKPVTPAPTAAVSVPAQAAAKIQEVASNAATQVKLAATRVQAAHADMPGWKRALTVGLLGLGGLIGYKAVKK